jgi:hypothetical protein
MIWSYNMARTSLKKVPTAPKADAKPEKKMIDAADALGDLPIVHYRYVPEESKPLLHGYPMFLHDLLDDIYLQALHRIANLPRGVNLSPRQLCRRSFWMQMTPWTQERIGQCLDCLVARNALPLVYAGETRAGAPKFKRL